MPLKDLVNLLSYSSLALIIQALLVQKQLTIPIFLVIGVIFSTIASFVFDIPLLMPILDTAVPYPISLLRFRNKEYKNAF